jgi:hypothetical protein
MMMANILNSVLTVVFTSMFTTDIVYLSFYGNITTRCFHKKRLKMIKLIAKVKHYRAHNLIILCQEQMYQAHQNSTSTTVEAIETEKCCFAIEIAQIRKKAIHKGVSREDEKSS